MARQFLFMYLKVDLKYDKKKLTPAMTTSALCLYQLLPPLVYVPERWTSDLIFGGNPIMVGVLYEKII
jgi:hypothetical protein